MEKRELGKVGRSVSVIGLGTWQLGADWGTVEESDALAVLEAAVEAGVTFFDTADVYGDGRSEQLIGSFQKANPGIELTVGTKMGRRLDQVPQNYVLDHGQRHRPPTSVYSSDAVYEALDTLVEEQRIASYGVSVETTAEAMTA